MIGRRHDREGLDELVVCFGELQRLKIGRTVPAETVMVLGDGLRIGRAAEPEMKIDRAVRVGPHVIPQQSDRRDDQTGLFPAFPAGGVPGTFTGMTFSAGEFCTTWQRAVITANADKKPPGPFNDSNPDRYHR